MGLQTETITLIKRTQSGTDALGTPVYEEEPEQVDGVLIGEPDTQEVVDEMTLSGKRIAYVLAIPKGDEHIWEDTFVEFWGGRYRTVGSPTQGIEANIPLCWNKKVKVERYVSEN